MLIVNVAHRRRSNEAGRKEIFVESKSNPNKHMWDAPEISIKKVKWKPSGENNNKYDTILIVTEK